MFLYAKGQNSTFAEMAKEHYKNLFPTLKRRLETAKKPNNKTACFFKDICKNDYEKLGQLIMGDPTQLDSLVKQFERNVSNKSYPSLLRKNKKNKLVPTDFANRIKTVFSYQEFSNNHPTNWNAYQLTSKLGIDVCPYCNRSYVHTLIENKGVVRPELDHFLAQQTHPYLSLSFYNLIPSCHICNANLKLAKAFNLQDYVHPYRDALDAMIRFSVRFKKKQKNWSVKRRHELPIDFFYGNLDSFDIVVKSKQQGTIEELRRAARSLRVFKILPIYQFHKDLITEVIQNTIIYDEAYIQGLLASWQGRLFGDRNDVIRHITHNFTTAQDMPKRIFSKLYRDISLEFELA